MASNKPEQPLESRIPKWLFWTGFQGKTLWSFLELLIIPIAVGTKKPIGVIHSRSRNTIDNANHICATKAGHAEKYGRYRIAIQAVDKTSQAESGHEHCG